MADPAALVPSVTRSSELAPEEYPYSDGKLSMETNPHANSIVALHEQDEALGERDEANRRLDEPGTRLRLSGNQD